MKNNKKNLIKHVKRQAGLDREEFFKQGGELSRWRGMHQVYKDRKKEMSKKACRRNFRGRDY